MLYYTFSLSLDEDAKWIMEQLQKAPPAAPAPGTESKSKKKPKTFAQRPVQSLNHAQKMSDVYTKLRREGRGRRDMKDIRKRVQEFLNAKERERSS